MRMCQLRGQGCRSTSHWQQKVGLISLMRLERWILRKQNAFLPQVVGRLCLIHAFYPQGTYATEKTFVEALHGAHQRAMAYKTRQPQPQGNDSGRPGDVSFSEYAAGEQDGSQIE